MKNKTGIGGRGEGDQMISLLFLDVVVRHREESLSKTQKVESRLRGRGYIIRE
jgi:hypothetical protein